MKTNVNPIAETKCAKCGQAYLFNLGAADPQCPRCLSSALPKLTTATRKTDNWLLFIFVIALAAIVLSFQLPHRPPSPPEFISPVGYIAPGVDFYITDGHLSYTHLAVCKSIERDHVFADGSSRDGALCLYDQYQNEAWMPIAAIEKLYVVRNPAFVAKK